jgi:UDP-MurNAc hydroxylase
MRFTLIGHSTLLVETSGPRIVVDPWLLGSCYWRAWWHFPPIAAPSAELLAPDYVYATHHHFDHLHYPSMRRIDRRAHVLIPRFGVDVMADEIRGLGFDAVHELPHGRVVTLAPDVRVASYQYGFDDTAFVIADGPHVLVDVNDCKMRGRALRQLARDFPEPTFMFKSHSWAQSYPNCYEADDPRDLEVLSRQTYLDDFLGVARELRPGHAVPFGSMVAFLHPDTRDLNRHLVTPAEVAEAAHAAGGDVPVAVMTPGDSWDSEHGFSIARNDWYERRDAHLEQMAEALEPLMRELATKEAARRVDFATFAAYLERFARALPFAVIRRLLRRPIVCEGPSAPARYWTIDFATRSVSQRVSPPSNAASIILIPEAVLADAVDKGILHLVHGSMRIRTHLRAGGVDEDLAFWGLLMIWEIGYLPITRVLRPRFAGVLWRRHREALDAIDTLRGEGSLLGRLAGRFSPSDETPVDVDAAPNGADPDRAAASR